LAFGCLGAVLAVMTIIVIKSLFMAPLPAPVLRASDVPIEISHSGGIVNGNFTVLGTTPQHTTKQ
jgi:hypothetical protein